MYVNLARVLVRGRPSDTPSFLFLRDSVSHFKLNLSIKITNELVGIFQPSPGYYSIFFPHSSPLTQYLSTGWLIPLASFTQPRPQLPVSLPGWEFLCIFQPSPTQCLDHEWVCPGCFTRALSQYLSYWEGAGNLLHSQIKLRVSTSTGDSRTGRDLPKFVCTPQGGRLVQGAAAGTKARIPHGVQSKEGSPLWVTITVAITVD